MTFKIGSCLRSALEGSRETTFFFFAFPPQKLKNFERKLGAFPANLDVVINLISVKKGMVKGKPRQDPRPLASPGMTQVLGFALLRCRAARRALSGQGLAERFLGSARACERPRGTACLCAQSYACHKVFVGPEVSRWVSAPVPANSSSEAGPCAACPVARGCALGSSTLCPKKQGASLGGHGELCFHAPRGSAE